MRAKYILFLIVPLIVVGLTLGVSNTAQSVKMGDGQNVVVHLSKYTGDLHAVFMAVKLASAMQAGGADVTLFVDLEGVRLVDSRLPLNVMWGTAHEPLATHYEGFIKGGGQVIVCPHCAAAAGIGTGDLRPGATIGVPAENTIPNLLLEADKILDY